MLTRRNLNITPNSLIQACNSHLPFRPPVARTVQRHTSGSTRTEFSAELSVETAEGDTVSLSMKTVTESEFSDYRHLSRGAGHRFGMRARGGERTVTREVQLSVEGDLNERELADIQSLARILAKATRKFAHGNVDGAVRQASKIHDLGTVASVGMVLNQSVEASLTKHWSLEQAGRI